MTIPAEIESKRGSINALARKYRVKKLYLFGSSLRMGTTPPNDIDLLVRFESVPLDEYADNYFEFQEALEDLLTTSVDLVVEESLNNPFLIESINQSKIPLYG